MLDRTVALSLLLTFAGCTCAEPPRPEPAPQPAPVAVAPEPVTQEPAPVAEDPEPVTQEPAPVAEDPAPPGECEPLPKRQVKTDKGFGVEMVPQVGHVEEVYGAAFSPDGRFLATGGRDHTVRIWTVETGHLLRVLTARFEVRAVAFTADGETVVAGDARGNVWVWQVETGKKLLSLDPKRCGSISAIRVIGNRYVAVSCMEPEVKLVDITAGRYRSFPHLDRPRSGRMAEGQVRINALGIDVSKDGQRLLVGYEEGGLTLWSIKSGRKLWSVKAHSRDVDLVAFLDGGRVLSSASDGTKTWRVKNGKPLRPLELETIGSLVVAPDGRSGLVAVGSSSTLASRQTIHSVDLKTSKRTRTYDDRRRYTNAIAYSPDGHLVAAGDQENNVVVWDARTGARTNVFRGADALVWDLTTSPEGRTAASVGNGQIVVWSLEQAAVTGTIRAEYAAPMYLRYSPDGKFLLTSGAHGPAPALWDAQRGTQISKYAASNVYSKGMAFSADGRTIITAGGRGVLDFWERDSGRSIESTNTRSSVDALAVSPDGQRLYIATNYDFRVWDAKERKELSSFKLKTNGVHQIAPLPDGRHVALAQGGGPTIYDTETGKLVRRVGNSGQIYDSVAITSDGCRLAAGGTPRTLDIWDIASGDHVASFPSHANDTSRVIFLPNDRHLLTASMDGTIRLWDSWTGYSAVMLARDGEWLIYTDDGYFDASRRGGNLVAAVKGMKGYRIDQLGLRNNRPDMILERLELGTEELREHFHAMYLRRLKKAGLQESDLTAQFDLAPVAVIDKIAQRGKTANLVVTLSDAWELSHYNIYVNDVPIYGSRGESVSGKKQTLRVSIELTAGRNKIEVSAVNRLGIESMRPYRIAEYDAQTTADLYYLGFGVSQYRDPSLELKFAAKDAADLRDVFARVGGFRNIHTKLLVDDQVTREAVGEAKQFLEPATVDDTVVVFVAGHGLYGAEGDPNYYFVTHDTDLTRVADTAANFELLEELLQGIAPRRKLFLLDTCHSGELDEDAVSSAILADASSRGLQARGIRLRESKTVAPRKRSSSLYDRSRYIHNDLFRRSGAIVLSSSRGSELSYERDDLENGVFTEEVIKALTSSSADKNNDSMVSTDELRDYVITTVPKVTNNLQHPVVDRDNLEHRFSFSIR